MKAWNTSSALFTLSLVDRQSRGDSTDRTNTFQPGDVVADFTTQGRKPFMIEPANLFIPCPLAKVALICCLLVAVDISVSAMMELIKEPVSTPSEQVLVQLCLHFCAAVHCKLCLD